MNALRIVFAGTPDFALPAFRALLRSRHRVIGVLTQPDRPKGRGQHLAASPVKREAQSHGVPVSQPATLREAQGRADLVGWRPDVLVVVAYGLILPSPVLELPRLGCVNIHASLLPRWRGAAPIQRALLAGDSETGVTIMLMEAGLDTGPILLQEATPVAPMDTAGSLHDRLACLGADALLRALDELGAGSARARPQAHEQATYAPKIEKSESRIDWRGEALYIERQVRAFNPWPVAETSLHGEQLRIFAARAEYWAADPDLTGSDPGTIVSVNAQSISVQCGRGRLRLLKVQRPGRKPVSAGDFAHAVPLVGRRLG